MRTKMDSETFKGRDHLGNLGVDMMMMMMMMMMTTTTMMIMK
jgi:hypothetical protein